MKRSSFLCILIVIIVSLPVFMACGNYGKSSDSDDSTKVDTLLAYFQKIDSMQNCGALIHVDVYDIGNLGGVGIEVQNLNCQNEQLQFVNFSKRYGNSFYSEYVSSRMLPSEIKFFVSAIDSISKEYNRKVNHDERYAYITKDNIRLLAANYNFSDNKWHSVFDVDYRKNDGSVSLDEKGLQQLKKYLLQCQSKIDSIKASNYQ